MKVNLVSLVSAVVQCFSIINLQFSTLLVGPLCEHGMFCLVIAVGFLYGRKITGNAENDNSPSQRCVWTFMTPLKDSGLSPKNQSSCPRHFTAHFLNNTFRKYFRSVFEEKCCIFYFEMLHIQNPGCGVQKQ